jgi:hypothetical protein
MRRQFISGARSLVRIASGRTGGYWNWINVSGISAYETEGAC